jgi:probable rRNA maturation factor
VILDRQRAVSVDRAGVKAFVRDLRRRLRLGRKQFNVCFVSDEEIRRLNASFRGRTRPTDVLSFPWREADARRRSPLANGDFTNFLGEIVISAPAARRNARQEGHTVLNEICWLILHGLLHLQGYDHETDQGEMTRMELALRERLGIARNAKRVGARAGKGGKRR